MRLLLMALLLTACSSTSATQPKPTAPPSTEAAITLKGAGGSKSEPFSLQGGAYAVEWTAQASPQPTCVFITRLQGMNGKDVELISNITVTGTQRGRSTMTMIPAARYVVEASTSCDTWSFVISPTR